MNDREENKRKFSWSKSKEIQCLIKRGTFKVEGAAFMKEGTVLFRSRLADIDKSGSIDVRKKSQVVARH